MTTAVAEKADVHGRTEANREADRLFMEEFKRIEALSIKPIDPKRYGTAVNGAFLLIKYIRGEETIEEKVDVPPGLYDISLVHRLGAEMGKARLPASEISQRLFKEARIRYGVSVSTESGMGRKGSLLLAPTPDGYLSAPGIETPVVGTAVVFDDSGKPSFGSLTTKEEFLRWLPAIQAAWKHHNTWCVDLPSEKVADLADHTEAMLERLENQLKNLHGVSIYMIQPRWLRYYSDGSMQTQRSGAYGRRNAAAPYGGLRPLLYDGPAWVVGLRMGANLVPGRVFVTPEGKFIGSDWCQREVDKNGGIDLHTGEFTKHTLMTWCAGPGISRFGDHVIKQRHGELRRAQPLSNIEKVSLAKRKARTELLRLLVKTKNSKTEGKVMLAVNDEVTQVQSLRYFDAKIDEPGLDFDPYMKLDSDGEHLPLRIVGFMARFGKYAHIVSVALDELGNIIPASTQFKRYQGVLGSSWQAWTYCTRAIKDEAFAKSIVSAMKEAF